MRYPWEIAAAAAAVPSVSVAASAAVSMKFQENATVFTFVGES